MWTYLIIAIAGLMVLEIVARMARLALIMAAILVVLTANPTCFAAITAWLR